MSQEIQGTQEAPESYKIYKTPPQGYESNCWGKGLFQIDINCDTFQQESTHYPIMKIIHCLVLKISDTEIT